MGALTADQVADVQGFNKVYLALCKRMDDAILDAGYSLTEKDVLLEISKTERCMANVLAQRLRIDRSYMSRMMAKFERGGLIEKTPSQTDNRVRYIRLTETGRCEFNRLSDIQNEQIQGVFAGLDEPAQRAITDAMVMIRTRLSEANDVISVRPFTLGDIEYVVSRHKTLYYAERHLSEVFSEYVDRIVSDFVENFDPGRDCLNILECNGVPAGSMGAAHVDGDTAQLRFFMLEPELRRCGYGNMLFERTLDFCREKGYRCVFLLTITAQTVARRVFVSHGFALTWSRDKSEWGEGIVEERWDMRLE